VRDDDAFRLGGRDRREDDLGGVAVGDVFTLKRRGGVTSNGVGQLIEPQARQVEPTRAAVDEQSSIDLLLNACGKIGRALDVERHDDDAARQRAEESRHPLGAVLAPKQDALAFGNAAPVKLARELEGRVAQPPVSPALRAQAAPVREGYVVAVRHCGVEEADERSSHHLHNKSRGAATATAVVTLGGGVTRAVCRVFARCCNMTA